MALTWKSPRWAHFIISPVSSSSHRTACQCSCAQRSPQVTEESPGGLAIAYGSGPRHSLQRFCRRQGCLYTGAIMPWSSGRKRLRRRLWPQFADVCCDARRKKRPASHRCDGDDIVPVVHKGHDPNRGCPCPHKNELHGRASLRLVGLSATVGLNMVEMQHQDCAKVSL